MSQFKIKFISLRESHGRGEKYVNQKRWRTTRKQNPLNQHEQRSYDFTDTKAACTGPV